MSVNSSSSAGETGDVFKSFRRSVFALDRRVVETRVRLYGLLDLPLANEDRNGDGLPRESWVVHRGDISITSLNEYFGKGRYPTLGCGEMNGVTRLTWEARNWSFEPFHRGWLKQQQLMRFPARPRVEAFILALARWAFTHPNVATLGPLPRLPQQALSRFVDMAGADGDSEMNKAILFECGEGAIALAASLVVPEQRSFHVLNSVRGKLADVRFPDPMGDEGQRLLRAIGRFMSMATDSSDPPNPHVISALKGAVLALNSQPSTEIDEHDI